MLPARSPFPQLSQFYHCLHAPFSTHLVWCYYSPLAYLLTGMQWNVNSLPCYGVGKLCTYCLADQSLPPTLLTPTRHTHTHRKLTPALVWPPSMPLIGWWMRPKVKSGDDTREFVHEQWRSLHVRPTECVLACPSACACAPRLTVHGTLTHTPRRGHAGNLSLITAGTASRAILWLNLLAFWYLLTLYPWPLANVLPWI